MKTSLQIASAARLDPIGTIAERAGIPERFVEHHGRSTAKIDLNVQNSSITSVLRTFAEFANVNIVPGPEVEGKVTAKIEDVPWLIAFDTVLRAHGFGWEQQNDIIRVSTLEKLSTERLNLQVNERKREDFLRRVETEGGNSDWRIARRKIILDQNVLLSKNLTFFF